ncbi:subtilase family peptidase [Anopheles sinensis]|uniref:Subtilase family peptidase n=1 Tax=Anopheles sinensis TaxID=74873 RepID=A0A084WTF9_ANOSI|nr:subtilase family peptidase [Anopheles sinensis]
MKAKIRPRSRDRTAHTAAAASSSSVPTWRNAHTQAHHVASGETVGKRATGQSKQKRTNERTNDNTGSWLLLLREAGNERNPIVCHKIKPQSIPYGTGSRVRDDREIEMMRREATRAFASSGGHLPTGSTGSEAERWWRLRPPFLRTVAV